MLLFMTEQSTRHLYMIEPAVFYANPETLETNNYQEPDDKSAQSLFEAALREFRGLRDALVENGVFVSTLKGSESCPDHLFPNWFMTHRDRTFSLYPMMNDNRRAERVPGQIAWLSHYYGLRADYSAHERDGRYLEGTSALWLDRPGQKAYVALSARVNEDLAREWCRENGYEPIIFETSGHNGKPVYHTDVALHIGTGFAGVCTQAILPQYRDTVLGNLQQGREVIEITPDQMRSFCGNALEVLGRGDKKMLVMSDTAYSALRPDQKEAYLRHVTKIIHAPLPVIEQYGGGSARCMVQELF
jgi:hypothetical protein